MRNSLSIICLSALTLSGCPSGRIPATQGDIKSAPSYGYRPIDSLPITISPANATRERRLNALPDETMRLAIGQFDGKADIPFGPATAGVAGNNDVVILDYTKFTTKSFGVKKTTPALGSRVLITITTAPNPDVVVPVYVGVGLRLTANIYVKEGSVDLGNLFALDVAALCSSSRGWRL